MQVIPLFSTPLYRAHVGEVDPITLNWIRNLEYPHRAVGHTKKDLAKPQHDRGFDILEHNKMQNLKKIVLDNLSNFVYNILGYEKNFSLYINTSWINRVSTTEDIPIHNHPNSIFSGVYYIDVGSSPSPIQFVKNKNLFNVFSSTLMAYSNREKVENQFTADTFSITPQNGELLIFPSSLEHRVFQSEVKEDRYSLAFNTFVEGTFGNAAEKITLRGNHGQN